LMKDVEDYSIPVKREKVLKVIKGDDKFTVITDKGEYTSLAVVMATGMRMTWNEKEYFGGKLFGTLKGYRFMEDYFTELCESEKGKTMVFVGTEEMNKTIDFFENINRGRMKVKKVLDRGTNIRGYKDDIIVMTDEGDVPGDLVLIDFESYMLSTYTGNMIESHKDERGFIKADKRCRVQDGLFAAGDITGTPFSLAKAVGEGTTAGLESYRYVYRKKFGKEAPVYAFYPIHDEGSATYFEIPELKDDYRPKLLVDPIKKDDKFIFRECEIEDNELNSTLLEKCDGQHTLKDIRDELGDIDEKIKKLINAKDLTLEV